jgi:hypothetical protein
MAPRSTQGQDAALADSASLLCPQERYWDDGSHRLAVSSDHAGMPGARLGRYMRQLRAGLLEPIGQLHVGASINMYRLYGMSELESSLRELSPHVAAAVALLRSRVGVMSLLAGSVIGGLMVTWLAGLMR